MCDSEGNVHISLMASKTKVAPIKCLTIDYRATYVYGIGNECVPLIVLHWAALKRSSKYIVLAKIN